MLRFSVVFLIAVLGCIRPAKAPQAKPSPDVVAVYTMLLDTLFGGSVPDTLVVADSSVEIQAALGNFTGWLSRTMADRLALVKHARVPSTQLGIPRPMKLVTRAQMDSLNSADDVDWKRFHSRYPKARALTGFSPVTFSEDGRQAVVFGDFECGGRCQQARAIEFERVDGGWRVVHVATFFR